VIPTSHRDTRNSLAIGHASGSIQPAIPADCVRPVNRIFSQAGLASMMERLEFPTRRRDHGESSTWGGGLGGFDRRVA
jgi:hypothetical protein